jgi:hypothetical protein
MHHNTLWVQHRPYVGVQRVPVCKAATMRDKLYIYGMILFTWAARRLELTVVVVIIDSSMVIALSIFLGALEFLAACNTPIYLTKIL